MWDHWILSDKHARSLAIWGGISFAALKLSMLFNYPVNAVLWIGFIIVSTPFIFFHFIKLAARMLRDGI